MVMSKRKSLRVAAIQMAPKYGKIRENLEKAAQLVVQAAKGGAQLIVLPELVTSGYSIMSASEAELFAEPVHGWEEFAASRKNETSFFVFSKLSSTLNVCIAWGFVEKDPNTGSLYNSQALYCPDGRTIHYQKVNRWGNDFLWATPGRSNPPILNVDFTGHEYKVGLLICRDVRDKKDSKWTSFYEAGDADVVCLSSNWGDGGFPSISWMDFVEENKTNLIVANRYGQEANNNFGEGGICVIQRDGVVQCDGLLWSKDCIVYGTILREKEQPCLQGLPFRKLYSVIWTKI